MLEFSHDLVVYFTTSGDLVRLDKVRRLVNRLFEAYNYRQVTGVWQGETEPNLVVEVSLNSDCDIDRIFRNLRRIYLATGEQALYFKLIPVQAYVIGGNYGDWAAARAAVGASINSLADLLDYFS